MRIKIVFIVLTSILLFACNVTRKLPAGESLLTENNINISYPDSIVRKERVLASELNRFIPLTQVPNKRLLGANFFLWIYNLSDSSKDNGFNRFLRRVGEAPVVVDTTSIPVISHEMELYMRANGFYNSTIKDSIVYKRKRAYINYDINAEAPYIISSINYTFNDKSLQPIILDDTASSLLKIGKPLSRLKMGEESSRIAAVLENLGYYQFSTNNIRYVVDTLGLNRKAKVDIVINKTNIDGELENNKIYRVRNVYINTNYRHKIGIDTTQYDTVNTGVLNFIYARGERRNLHPDVMARAVTLYPNLIYSKDEIDYTSSNIQNLKFFRSVNILFNEIEGVDNDFVTFVNSPTGGSAEIVTPEGYIDCTILCSPMKRQNYRANFEVSTNDNYTGVTLTLGYGNRNLFRRAEQFNINLTTSYDFMRRRSARDSYELGVGVSFSIPRLASPRFFSRHRNLFGTSTTIDASYSSQRRPDYDRNILNASYGYSWTSNKFFNYTFRPLNIGVINVPWIRDEFLDDIENPYLRNSYLSQMILGTLTSFRYSTQSEERMNSINVRTNIETSGNFLNLASNILGSTKHYSETNDYYEAFGIAYSQYIRSDIDISVKHNLNSKGSSALVYRFFAGGGYSYGNSVTLPFERMFYVGGSNSMRGWQIRTLGPGGTSSPDKNSYPNQVGNIRLEANVEGRFPVWGPLNGALFFDLGNIWYNGLGDEYTASRFEWDSFYKQLGFNTGLGARLDFGYFVLRVDWGIQLHNPGHPAGERWIREFNLQNSAVHFGIGYPF